MYSDLDECLSLYISAVKDYKSDLKLKKELSSIIDNVTDDKLQDIIRDLKRSIYKVLDSKIKDSKAELAKFKILIRYLVREGKIRNAGRSK